MRRICVRVISLERSVDRRERVTHDLLESDFQWSFFSALNSMSPCTVESHPEQQKKRYGRSLTEGEIGCFKSHFALLQSFASQSEVEWMLVLEDDVCLDTNFSLDLLIDAIEKLDIRFIRLFSRRFKPAKVLKQLGAIQILRYKTDPYGTQAYLINRKAAFSFIESVQSIVRPIDDEMGRFWSHGLPIYSVYPHPVFERAVASTLEAERVNNTSARWNKSRYFYRVFDYVHKAVSNVLWDSRWRRMSARKNG